MGTLVELLERRAASPPDRAAYRYLDNGEVKAVSLTYPELLAQSAAFGATATTSREASPRVGLA
jgi:acyl-CoA synthetase (AMP-forming)/AMP-acid ligase II